MQTDILHLKQNYSVLTGIMCGCSYPLIRTWHDNDNNNDDDDGDNDNVSVGKGFKKAVCLSSVEETPKIFEQWGLAQQF